MSSPQGSACRRKSTDHHMTWHGTCLMSRKKKKKLKKQDKAFPRTFVAQQVREVEPRQCYWVVTAEPDVTVFRRLYGMARNYAGMTDRWCEVQPDELQFHFAEFNVARSFAKFCLKKGYEITLRDKRKRRRARREEHPRPSPRLGPLRQERAAARQSRVT